MGNRFPGTLPSASPPEDRLDSWKEIASYLKRDLTTVQRWEKREGMPVHRHQHERTGSVYAYRAELDAWARGRNLRATPENETSVPPPVSSAASPTLAQRPFLARWKFLFPVGAVAAALGIATILWFQRTERFWRSPLTDAQFQTVTDFDGLEQAAAVSRDGHFVAFLSNRDGPMDVWVTQVGTGQFHNLTHGSAPELVNPSIRTLGFSPDGSLVTYWVRTRNGSGTDNIDIWAVPILGGQPRPYLEGVAEFDWSHDGSQVAYHTPGPGDPLFVSSGDMRSTNRPIFTAPNGLHSHFPLWAPNGKFIYFVQGALPDRLDIWRIRSTGGVPERITTQNRLVSHPVLLDQRTLLYLACDADGSGPWPYSIDVEHRIPHRLTAGPERFTSLAVTTDGRRLVATVASPKRTLWRLKLADSHTEAPTAAPILLTTGTGFSPRLGPDFLLYVSVAGSGESIWKLAEGTNTELWRGEGASIFGGPAISADGQHIAFSIRQHGQTFLYAMQADGTNPRIVADSLDLQGTPAWSPDGQSITSAATDHGVPHLFRVPVDGRPPTAIVQQYSTDPAWSPDGTFALYSGPDVGTTFSLQALTAGGASRRLPPLTLTRGARRLAFLPGGRELVLLRGEIQHKDLWAMNLETGAQRRLTSLPSDFDIHDFDVSRDGHEVVLERIEERSDVVLIDLARR